jgi:hypothetical protein
MLLAFQVPEANKEANLREGAYVTVTSDVQRYMKECRAIGLSWPNDSKGRPRSNAIDQRARIVKMDLDKKTVCLSDNIEWVPIKGLIGFDDWGQKERVSYQMSRSSTKTLEVATNKHDEAEVRIFWLLHTLIGSPKNQSFREYYGIPATFNNYQYMPTTGAPSPLAQQYNPDDGPIADRKGAMEDVNRVSFFIARFDKDLWIHLNALGFHLSTVFYGAFMRLFSSFLPAHSLFRFWDVLLAECANPMRPKHKPARHVLIDFAFGLLTDKQTRSQLLAAESALEAKDCIIDAMENMYDPSEVVRIVIETEEYLWDEAVAGALGQVGLDHMHVMEYEKQVKMWEQYFVQFRAQNVVMRNLTQDPNAEIAPDQVPVTRLGASKDAKPDTRITTKNVVNHIIPTLQDLLLTEGIDRSKFGGMLRQTPSKIRELGPECEGSVIDKVSSWFSWAQEAMMPEDLTQTVAYGVKPPPETDGEPTTLSHLEFSKQVHRGLGSAWSTYHKSIYETFASPIERRMSLNEFFIALICCSKGTVGEKAMALFHLYAFASPEHRVKHITPITHRAHTVVEKIEGLQDKLQANIFKPPSTAEIAKTTVLHFMISTQDGTMPHEVMGEVFLPTLRPYLWSKMGGDAEPHNFTIWGVNRRLPPGWRNMGNNKNDVLSEHGVRPVLGEMTMRIKWMPLADSPSVGQLVVRIMRIKFNPKTVEAPKEKNPKVEVQVYDDDGETSVIRMKNGQIMEWKPTMYTSLVGTQQRVGSYDGWDVKSEAWVWSQKAGEMFSEPNLKIRKDMAVKNTSTRPNTISIEACRLLTQGIMNRCLHTVTTRQAALISDQIFNRTCAVPAILDAVIVQGESQDVKYTSLKDLKEDFDANRRSYVNITHQLILAHENSVCVNGGSINLFPPSASMGGNNFTHLNHIKIQDPFPQQKKVMWIRFARAGDGDRRNVKIDISEEGNFRPANVPLDMGMETKAEKVQMSITKEEFVTCVLQSPLLSESLRQLSTRDNNCERVPNSQPVKLDISIADPHKEEMDDDLIDSMTVRQGILFEVWDHSHSSKNPFLGEAWLPAWSTILQEPRSFALPLTEYDESSSRPDAAKNKKPGVERTITGYITVEASWNFPAEQPAELGPNPKVEDVKKQQELLHTGLLKLKIIKADNLFSADAEEVLTTKKSKQKKYLGDPYVIMHIRNEAITKNDPHLTGFTNKGWRMAHGGGLGHAGEWKTAVKKGTPSPEWNEEKEFKLKTGSFELKEKKERLHRGRQDMIKDQDDVFKAGDTEELKIHFGDVEKDAANADKPGHRHNVEVYLGDSVHMFKAKLQRAARMEAEKETNPKRKGQYEAIADEITQKHVVMVFVASQKLRELSRTKPTSTEYSKMFKDELRNEPSSWQPLDSMRTFNHYTAIHGFGMDIPQRLRICEGGEDYRLRNGRYNNFMKDQEKWATKVELTNTDKECWGYAKYIHKLDGNSTEWRQVIAQRAASTASDPKRRYAVSFLHAPLSAAPGPGAAARPEIATSSSSQSLADGEPQMQEREEDAVLLWPNVPKIDGSQDLEHQELLRKVPQLKEQGLSEAEIANALNEELGRRLSLASAGADGDDSKRLSTISPADTEGSMERASITVTDVQHALKQADLEASNEVHADPKADPKA